MAKKSERKYPTWWADKEPQPPTLMDAVEQFIKRMRQLGRTVTPQQLTQFQQEWAKNATWQPDPNWTQPEAIPMPRQVVADPSLITEPLAQSLKRTAGDISAAVQNRGMGPLAQGLANALNSPDRGMGPIAQAAVSNFLQTQQSAGSQGMWSGYQQPMNIPPASWDTRTQPDTSKDALFNKFQSIVNNLGDIYQQEYRQPGGGVNSPGQYGPGWSIERDYKWLSPNWKQEPYPTMPMTEEQQQKFQATQTTAKYTGNPNDQGPLMTQQEYLTRKAAQQRPSVTYVPVPKTITRQVPKTVVEFDPDTMKKSYKTVYQTVTETVPGEFTYQKQEKPSILAPGAAMTADEWSRRNTAYQRTRPEYQEYMALANSPAWQNKPHDIGSEFTQTFGRYQPKYIYSGFGSGYMELNQPKLPSVTAADANSTAGWYGGTSYPSYGGGGGGGGYTDINKWYENMVSWNIQQE